jgi:hypothetical protein
MDMTTPIVVQLASLVPGLGFWLLGKWKEAIITELVVLISALFFFQSASSTASQVGFFTGVFTWVVSANIANYEARILKKIKTENYQKARDVKNLPAPTTNIKRSERYAYKWEQMLKRQLDPGEHLVEFISATQRSFLGRMTTTGFYRLVLLENSLMFVILSIFNKPEIFRKVPFGKIESVEYKHGLVSDTLKICLQSEKAIKLQVARTERERADMIVDRIRSRMGQQVY